MREKVRHPAGTARRVLGTTAASILWVLIFAITANAHVFSAPTHLTIHVSGSTVSGMLVGRLECRGGQTVLLVIDGQVIDSTTTDAMGRYAFADAPPPPVSIQTRFGGSHTGFHPHRHICQPSDSRVVRPTAVRGASGARNSTGGADQSGVTAFTGADLRLPIVLILTALLVGASLLVFTRRRSG